MIKLRTTAYHIVSVALNHSSLSRWYLAAGVIHIQNQPAAGAGKRFGVGLERYPNLKAGSTDAVRESCCELPFHNENNLVGAVFTFKWLHTNSIMAWHYIILISTHS